MLVANVGDCRALIISGGRPIQMSIDQKPTIPEEVKRINSLGGTVGTYYQLTYSKIIIK